MNTQTINIALPRALMVAIDRAAKAEYRNRSEFIREAIYHYLKDKQAWNQLFRSGEAAAKRLGITSEAQVNRMVMEYRHSGK